MNVVFDLESVGDASVEGVEVEMTELEYWITLIIDSLTSLSICLCC